MNNTPKIVDLFSGAGGLSLGAARAGFSVWGAVEVDKFAIDTHCRNFPTTKHLARDVAQLSAQTIHDHFGLTTGEIFGIIGGPPCQGFSVIGRGQPDDPRNDLFRHFFRLVGEIAPAFFLAENVTGILHQKYDTLRDSVFKNTPKEYHLLQPIKIKASDYGAPTTRTRIFFLGYNPKKFRACLTEDVFLPVPETAKTVVGKALYGLPLTLQQEKSTGEFGWQKFTPPEHGPSDFFFSRATGTIPPHIGDPSHIERYSNGYISGCLSTKHTSCVEQRYKALAHGQRDQISKSVKLDPNGFCPTLRAGTDRDKGSYQAVRPIHYDAPRVISPREAARLQGFPDWFTFQPTIWHSFRQIGNSVSPIAAEHILKALFNAI